MSFESLTSYFWCRRRILSALYIITLLGLLLWWYDGPGRRWFNFYLTCAAYEIFWCLVAFFFWPRKKDAWLIALVVLLLTCGIEFLQLWQPPFLQLIRSTFFGMALIGTDFVWGQFPYYFVGSLIGWFLMRHLGLMTPSGLPLECACPGPGGQGGDV
ncbi:MAG TPA: DUF2809 domain-containing protein [Planctomycetes bacterium]|nr:DUF2809 domain-containing protein [Planctomycetota bacterium]